MVGIIILMCLVAAASATAVYYYLYPKVQRTVQLDLETQNKNDNLRTELLQLTEQTAILNAQKDQITQHISEIQKQAEESAEALYEKSYNLANEKMSAAADKMSADFERDRQKLEQEYLEIMAANSEWYNQKMDATATAIKHAETRLADLSAKVSAATEAAKRQEEMETAQDFYRLNLSNIDIEEITKLRQVTVLLRDSEPLNKVIWKVYYEKPYTDLIGRIIGSGIHTGIYKITNIQNQKCYVGQAADLASRWRQHIKRGIGAEAPTRNKLYPAMQEIGVENFTFEVVEECSREKLNEREDYWQEYFGAKEFGYSIK